MVAPGFMKIVKGLVIYTIKSTEICRVMTNLDISLNNEMTENVLVHSFSHDNQQTQIDSPTLYLPWIIAKKAKNELSEFVIT